MKCCEIIGEIVIVMKRKGSIQGAKGGWDRRHVVKQGGNPFIFENYVRAVAFLRKKKEF